MSEYAFIVSAVARLSVADGLHLIDDLAATVPDDRPPALSDEWLAEIQRRSAGIDAVTVEMEPWFEIRGRLL